MIPRIIVLVVLLFFSAFFSSAETALTTVNKVKIRSLAEEGNNRAKLVLKITEDSGRMLSAILIGNNLVNLSASSIATVVAVEFFGSSAAGIATGILTLLILIFGEISPKTMATIRAERISLKYSRIIWGFMTVLTPVIFVVNILARGFLRLLGVKSSEAKQVMTEGELRAILRMGQETGVIESDEKEIIDNVFDFGDAMAREVMIPQIDVTFLPADSTYDDVVELYRTDPLTRFPVYRESTDDVVGILNIKDLLLCDRGNFSVEQLMRKPFYTYEQKNTADLMVEMQNKRIPMAIVLNEYGTTAGIITLEDLLEEIVGEIRDEYDEDEEDPVLRLSDRDLLVLGSYNLEDFCQEFHLKWKSEDNDTVGGYMIELLDHLPKLRESVTTEDGVFLQVRSKTQHKIDKLYVRFPKPEHEEETEVL